jgi:ABC-type multidrug transport system fused ATPase/permease subunit
MTPAEWYRARTAHWSAVRETAERAGIAVSRLRLVSFLGAVVLLVWGIRTLSTTMGMGASAAGIVLLIVFGVLVVRHARILEQVDRATSALALNGQGLARLDRDWSGLPEVPAPPTLDFDAHPYVRDLDIFGHASLTKWLGRAATPQGSRRLADWLLTPADASVVVERQPAVEALAAEQEWREQLAIEGDLTRADAGELARFLEWAEGTDQPLPRVMQAIAVVLPLFTIPLLFGFLLGAIADTWFLLPLGIAIVLSFAFARRMYASFDRATLGQRSLERYAAMLALACRVPPTGNELSRIKDQLRAGGDAPASVARLARLGGWSELRTSAALFHGLIQALTMWDFHVSFAFERWRRRSGRHVRGWIDALGSVDALAVLARVRADNPSWVQPSVDTAAGALRAIGLGHPLLAETQRVSNDVNVGPARSVLLITGSNMSGKSTLLRAIGLNAVLAQAGAPVCATAFTMPSTTVQTSIRVQDSLELGLSYFMAALARLKQIVDAAERGPGPGRILLYLLDEVLQGTNSVERGVAVRAVVRHLLDAGAIGVITTHDLGLAEEEPLKSCATLAHFTEQVHPDGTMTFDYRLRPGLATSTNALRLMQLIGIAPR